MTGLIAFAAVVGVTFGVAHADPSGIDVRVPDHLSVDVGAATPLEVAIRVDRGLVVSKDAPVIIDLEVGAGIAIKKHRLGRADAVDPGADAPRYAIPTRGDVAGETAVHVRIRMWVCGGRACRPVDVRRTAQVTVSAPVSASVSPASPP